MNRSDTRAYTIVELMVVIAIIFTLAAIALPAYVGARARARIEDDKQRLHQIQLALALYQIDSGTTSALPFGLPAVEDVFRELKAGRSFYGLRWDMLHSACGKHPKSLSPAFQWFLGMAPTGAFADFVERHGERSPLMVDCNCNDAVVDITADFVTKRGIAVLVDGSLVVKRGQGSINNFRFWEMN